MIIEKVKVVENVTKYFREKLPQYDVLHIERKSAFPEDAYLYMVVARKVTANEYAVWTGWNDSLQSLNHGHYGLKSLEDCQKVLEEFYNRG